MSDTIVIADDNPENLDVLCSLLKASGYAVHPSNDGAMVLRALQHVRADLILLDIRMPEMDGYQVCKALKKNPATHDIPVIFISALHEPLDKFKAFTVGGVDYICKPFDQEEVLARVSTHVQLYRLQKLQQRYAEELEAEVKHKTTALREANAGLEKALHIKEDFLGLINHELRTPLNHILGVTGILRNCSTQERAELIDIVEESGFRLLRLLENLVQMTSLGYTVHTTEEQSDHIDIEQVCTESLRIVTKSAEEKNLSIHLNIDVSVCLDMPLETARIRQILVNLLDNAVKFTPPNGDIGLDAFYDKTLGLLYVDVWDTGPGIPETERDRIFEPFVQLEPLLTRHNEGAGLGLALARNLLHLHNGQIQVAQRDGGGSVFQACLPAKPALVDEQTDVDLVNFISPKSFIVQLEETGENKLTPSQAQQLLSLMAPFDLEAILQFTEQLKQTDCCPALAKRVTYLARTFKLKELRGLVQSAIEEKARS